MLLHFIICIFDFLELIWAIYVRVFSAISFFINSNVAPVAFWKEFLFHLILLFLTLFNNLFRQILDKMSLEWQKSMSFDIYSCFWWYRIACHFHLLISNFKLKLSFYANCLSNFLYRSLLYDKNPYPLIYLVVLGDTKYCIIFIYYQCQI